MNRKHGPYPPAELPYALFRRATLPALVAAAICVVVSTAVAGLAGLWGSLAAAGIVTVFYATDLVALRLAERSSGSSLMPLMLFEYVAKISVIALLLTLIWDTTALSTKALAATIALATVVWTFSLAVFAARAPTYVVDLRQVRQPDS